jgi:cystathionine beta-lyase
VSHRCSTPPGSPGHEHFLRDFAGTSGLFAFVLDGSDDDARAALIDTLALFGIGFSWGGFESLALPIDPNRHRSIARRDYAGPLVRLQIGLEDPDDLIADLDAGLAAFRRASNRV